MFAVFATVLCLVSVSRSAPLACENLVRPLERLDPLHLEGRWTLVAGSLNDSADAATLKGRDSVTIDFNNSTYTQVNRVGDKCDYDLLNITFEGHIMSLQTRNYNFSGTFFQTSCPDCAVLSLDVKSQSFKSVDLYLFSRRREVKPKEMEDFRAQVECLNMPAPVVMDPTKELCPEQVHNTDDASQSASRRCFLNNLQCK
uniref:Apolipoprotein M n=1 Tax=Seriola lalandi dorsalis TaxID=1841481 RepID=A0A3B4Y135_SERLL